MITLKTRELSGAALDWAVAKCGGLCDEHGISVVRCNDLYFPKGNEKGESYEPYFRATRDAIRMYGPTMLIAVMRCYVASKYGDDIAVPEELA